MKNLLKITFLLILLTLLTACGETPSATTAPEAQSTQAGYPPPQVQPTLAGYPAPEEQPTQAPYPGPATAVPPAQPVLPPEPRPVTFQTSDGVTLQGAYYPPDAPQAPLVVLMHWAPGDQTSWDAIAPWLQNRGLVGGAVGGEPWLDSSWFPAMNTGFPVGVFTFTFRGCEGGCKNFDRAAWLLDAQAAMQQAILLPGVNPEAIVTIGASIGADGAADGCAWLNQQGIGRCWGALSLSPGNYLTQDYPTVVTALGENVPPTPAWCLYATGDGESAGACKTASGENYRAVEYEGNAHGMMIIAPDMAPNALELILEFLGLTLGG